MPISPGLADRPAAVAAVPSDRAVQPAMMRGAACRCPACGHGSLYSAYLKVEHACRHCGEVLAHHRADDAPAYFTMVIVGHFVVGGLLAVERAFSPPTWVQLAIWLPLTLVMSLALLPVVKGSLVALQWALRMHGFGAGEDPAASPPDPATAMASTSEGPKG